VEKIIELNYCVKILDKLLFWEKNYKEMSKEFEKHIKTVGGRVTGRMLKLSKEMKEKLEISEEKRKYMPMVLLNFLDTKEFFSLSQENRDKFLKDIRIALDYYVIKNKEKEEKK